jgi:SAM-dependent methyltransferase
VPQDAIGSRVAPMTDADRRRWDERYATKSPPTASAVAPPNVLARYTDVFPVAGTALDLACGQGIGAVWLALRGLEVLGLDISPVAVRQARELAQRSGVGDRCRFDVADFDDGLPAGPPVDVIVCHKFPGSSPGSSDHRTTGPGRAAGDSRAQRGRGQSRSLPRGGR